MVVVGLLGMHGCRGQRFLLNPAPAPHNTYTRRPPVPQTVTLGPYQTGRCIFMYAKTYVKDLPYKGTSRATPCPSGWGLQAPYRSLMRVLCVPADRRQ